MNKQARDSNSEPQAAFHRGLSQLHFKTEYRSLKEDPATLFYRPCLLNSTSYKRAVGYFRSSVYLVVGTSVVEFARRGGWIKLICSPDLALDDVDGIAAGYAKRSEIIEQRLLSDIDKLLAEPSTSYQTQILATLIAIGQLDLKLALRADRKGIYHEKIGIFKDTTGNSVSFKGSANETWSGWHPYGNFESIEVFCSWRGGLEAARVDRHDSHFDSLWSGNDPDVEVFPFPSVAVEYLKKAALRGLEAVEDISAIESSPNRTALPHQSAALAAWEQAGRRGILEHATGSGKTFTAILAIKQHIEQGQVSIVLVPSRLLLKQWTEELRAELPKAALLLAGAGNNKWKTPERLQGMTSDDLTLGGRIVLATMQTASSRQFRDNIIQGNHLLLVADEVHQIGSVNNSNFFSVDTGARLGLSATPHRYGDPEGTRRILDYFGGIAPPPVTLLDAIRAGRLVPYEYYPHSITLTAGEAAEWKEISHDIRADSGHMEAYPACLR